MLKDPRAVPGLGHGGVLCLQCSGARSRDMGFGHSRSGSAQTFPCTGNCSLSSTSPVAKGTVRNEDSCKLPLCEQNLPQIPEAHLLSVNWFPAQQSSCQCSGAKQGQYLSRYVLFVAQPRGVSVFCPHTVHGMFRLRSRPAVHLERSGYPLKRVSLNAFLLQSREVFFEGRADLVK